MSRSKPIDIDFNTRFPRVSGDEPAAYQDLGYRCEFSPRERG